MMIEKNMHIFVHCIWKVRWKYCVAFFRNRYIQQFILYLQVCRKPRGQSENNNVEDCVLQPNVSLPGVFGLTYYANPVMSVFLTESVIGKFSIFVVV